MNCTQYHFLSHLFLDSEFLCLVDSSSATGTALNQENGQSVKNSYSCRPACYKDTTSTMRRALRQQIKKFVCQLKIIIHVVLPSSRQNLHTRQTNHCQGNRIGSPLKLQGADDKLGQTQRTHLKV